MTSSVMITVIQAFVFSYTRLDFLHNRLVYGSGESLNQRHRTHRHTLPYLIKVWLGGESNLSLTFFDQSLTKNAFTFPLKTFYSITFNQLTLELFIPWHAKWLWSKIISWVNSSSQLVHLARSHSIKYALSLNVHDFPRAASKFMMHIILTIERLNNTFILQLKTNH